MNKFILVFIIVINSFLFNQESCDGHCLTDEQVKELRTSILELESKDSLNINLIDQLEQSIVLYKKYQHQDSLLIDLNMKKGDLLNQRIELYDQLVKEVKPKWYENKWLWFGLGVVCTAGSVKLASELVD